MCENKKMHMMNTLQNMNEYMCVLRKKPDLVGGSSQTKMTDHHYVNLDY